jgi:ABC-type Fe3+ transport system substrate-binding protein
MNGRYEITLENFKETNPQAAKQFVDFFYSQTE